MTFEGVWDWLAAMAHMESLWQLAARDAARAGLAGEWTLASFCDHLATLDPWPKPPEWEAARRFRNWAFESAALDLALRQAGRALTPAPMPSVLVTAASLDRA